MGRWEEGGWELTGGDEGAAVRVESEGARVGVGVGTRVGAGAGGSTERGAATAAHAAVTVATMVRGRVRFLIGGRL